MVEAKNVTDCCSGTHCRYGKLRNSDCSRKQTFVGYMYLQNFQNWCSQDIVSGRTLTVAPSSKGANFRVVQACHAIVGLL